MPNWLLWVTFLVVVVLLLFSAYAWIQMYRWGKKVAFWIRAASPLIAWTAGHPQPSVPRDPPPPLGGGG
jgi:hypothetical protein